MISRVMFLYWGRRGAVTKLIHDIGSSAQADDEVEASLSVSRQNEQYADFASFGRTLFPVDTFSSDVGAIANAWRIPFIGRALQRRLAEDRTEAVITLMPHVWSGAMIPYVRRAGVRYATIVHDADPHPGDRTSLVNRLLLAEADHADVVFTLSTWVRDRLLASGRARGRPIISLFHPDLHRNPAGPPTTVSGRRMRVLWLGRVLPYKNLGMFVRAIELLREQGVDLEVGVFGEGNLRSVKARLQALNAEVQNHWLSEAEVASALARYDVVALTHSEASQSGVAAAAFGAGLPVVATPVGGIVEQVREGHNGLLASDCSDEAFAFALRRLVEEPGLFAKLRENLRETSPNSVSRFLHELLRGVAGSGGV